MRLREQTFLGGVEEHLSHVLVDVHVEKLVFQTASCDQQQTKHVSTGRRVDGPLGTARVESYLGEAAVGQRQQLQTVQEVVLASLQEIPQQSQPGIPAQRGIPGVLDLSVTQDV